MKKNLFFLLLFGRFYLINAQVSMITSPFSQNLTKADLDFSGDRKLYAVGSNPPTMKNS